MERLKTGLGKGLSLFSIGVFDIATPLVRIICLSHLLTLEELGYASIINAVFTTLEQVTDILIHRFLFSCSRDEFDEALAAAHGLALLRGAALAVVMIVCAPILAHAFGRDHDWATFALIGAASFIRSLEHLEPRVAERDYRYGSQLKVSMASNLGGLATLIVAAFLWRDHRALLLSLLAQCALTAGVSWLVAQRPYRLRFRTPFFLRAWRFGYPLMFNGAGLAAMGQGDRFVVGALLGLPQLAIYSVAMLASTLPQNLMLKFVSTIALAALYNAKGEQFHERMRIFAICAPVLGGLYAMAMLLFFNPAIALVFGDKFVIPDALLAVLTLNAFFRTVRLEPFTTILLHEAKTATLAKVNLSAALGLGVGGILCALVPSFLSPLLGRIGGEIVALYVALRGADRISEDIRRLFLRAVIYALILVVVAIGLMSLASATLTPLLRYLALAPALTVLLVWSGVIGAQIYRAATVERRADPA